MIYRYRGCLSAAGDVDDDVSGASGDADFSM